MGEGREVRRLRGRGGGGGVPPILSWAAAVAVTGLKPEPLSGGGAAARAWAKPG
jgi:hypothetical protein